MVKVHGCLSILIWVFWTVMALFGVFFLLRLFGAALWLAVIGVVLAVLISYVLLLEE